MGTMQQTIVTKLGAAFAPEHLHVENESHQHNVPPGSESHFRVVIVSEAFAGVLPVARHRKVYAALSDELAGRVHALALHTYTPTEWSAQQEAPASPPCMGGSKHDR